MRQRVSLILILLFCGALSSLACYNVYYTADSNEHLHRVDRHDFERKLIQNFNQRLIVNKLKKKQGEIQESADYKILNDYAVLMIKIGKVEEALSILIALNQAYPDEYTIAANLGTTYELAGEVDSAFKYIERGMELNPESHGGSEWVHLEILETKKSLAADSTYLDRHTVLELTQEEEKDSVVGMHIWIQLTERFPFTPAGDPIMADLLEDLGDCWVNTVSVEYALTFYQIARDYHGNESKELTKKIEETKELIQQLSHIKPNPLHYPRHEMHQRVGRTNYLDMMDDHHEEGYEIPWEDFEINPDTLLSWVGMERYEFPVAQIDTTQNEEDTPGPQMNEKGKSDSLIWILLAGGVLIMVGMFFYLRKPRK